MQITGSSRWKTYENWSRRYNNPIISFYLGKTPNIVLNDIESAYELLEKRGEIYSSRPRNIMGQEILSGNMRGIGMAYGPRYRQWRKFQHTGMIGKAALAFRQVQDLESCVLLRDFFRPSVNYNDSLRRFATSVAFSISYGRRIRSLSDPIILENIRAQQGNKTCSFKLTYSLLFIFGNTTTAYSKTTKPGRYIVESWPFLLKLPKFLQWFRWEQDRIRQLDTEMYTRLLLEVKGKMDRGISKPCLSTNMFESVREGEMTLVQMAYNVSSSFAAGIATITATVEVFLMAMLHYPECLNKARSEIDSIVGRDRMPSFEDMNSLPYTNALIKEVLRWKPIARTGFAHATTKDDTYKGFYIPKGSVVYANIYAISKDSDIFPEPDSFIPERFISPTHPRVINFDLPFGFGRRICPGKQVALQAVFIIISRLIWGFNFIPPFDENNHPILPDLEAFEGELVTRPKPFLLRFEPRDRDTKKLMDSSAAEAEVELEGWD
ncbi:cytochrome P450 [Pyrrhoderma noxium]|uniref:Cytochrome P450 n=1 Tax=Pyrrhoderma noxium TaxID=2282107 RepID=A0A286UDH5_9AGAM|nr:cytochrome P450 [Pyrrhoderma noxium]